MKTTIALGVMLLACAAHCVAHGWKTTTTDIGTQDIAVTFTLVAQKTDGMRWAKLEIAIRLPYDIRMHLLSDVQPQQPNEIAVVSIDGRLRAVQMHGNALENAAGLMAEIADAHFMAISYPHKDFFGERVGAAFTVDGLRGAMDAQSDALVKWAAKQKKPE